MSTRKNQTRGSTPALTSMPLGGGGGGGLSPRSTVLSKILVRVAGDETVAQRTRIFIFPHSGGSAANFKTLAESLSPKVGVYVVQTMAYLNSVAHLNLELPAYLEAVEDSLSLMADLPYFYFGHSAGCAAAVKMANLVERSGAVEPPRGVFVSGSPALEFVETMPKGWDTDDTILVPLVRSWGGTSDSILDNRESLAFLLRTIRTDLAVSEAICAEARAGVDSARPNFPEEFRMRAPLTVVSGDADPNARVELLGTWIRYTSGEFQCTLMPGEHFYFNESAGREALVKALAGPLEEAIKVQRERSIKQAHEFNSNTMPYPDDKCLHDLFYDQAEKTPGALAVVDGNKDAHHPSLTLGEVDDLTEGLADLLVAEGVGVGRCVGIFMEKCSEFVLAYIAALKAGGAYLPIEIVYPQDLVRSVCETAEPVIILTKPEYEDRIPEGQKRFVFTSKWQEALAARAAPRLTRAERPRPGPDDLAYVVMSGGTTGTPKGMCCPHRGAVYSYYWRHERVPFISGDRVACNVFFVWELLRPLLRGQPMYIIPDTSIYDPMALAGFLATNQITRMLFTPSLLQLVVDTLSADEIRASMSSLRVIVLCGEVVSMELRNAILAILPRVSLLNLYSISECHDVSNGDLNDPVLDSPEGRKRKYAPCGQVMENVKVFCLDNDLEPVPLGETGELFVAGPTVALGYLKMPELTATRFLPNPFALGADDKVMYRTGDRARVLSDGTLELLGRCDFMVKIRGYSVVLPAVEVALLEHPSVSSTVVVPVGEEGTDKHLVAYIVPTDWERMPTANALRTFLKAHLPMYAIPPIMVPLKALPVHAASSKLDRRKLPAPTDDLMALMNPVGAAKSDAEAAGADSGPLNATESSLRAIWARLLNLEESSIGKSDDFFDIGGHSLLAARLAAAINRELGIPVDLSSITSYSTLKDLAACMDGSVQRSTSEPMDPSPVVASVHLPSKVSLSPVITARKLPLREVSETKDDAIFLTGATGFLGSYILAQFLTTSQSSVYALVRSETEELARERLVRTLEEHQLLSDAVKAALDTRLKVRVGDLSKPRLGLSQVDYMEVADAVQLVVHNGAEVNLMKPFTALEAANVGSTREIMRLAVTSSSKSNPPKHVVYVSTNSVFGDGISVCKEDADLDSTWTTLVDGYSQTKWVSEQICREARKRGIPVTVMRPGNMGPSSTTGDCNARDFIVTLLRGCLAIRSVPDVSDWALDLTPVDCAAKTMVALVQKPTMIEGNTYHLQSPHPPLQAKSAFASLDQVDAPMRRVPLEEWLADLIVAAEDPRASRTVATLSASVHSFIPYLKGPPKFMCSSMLAALASMGVDDPWPAYTNPETLARLAMGVSAGV